MAKAKGKGKAKASPQPAKENKTRAANKTNDNTRTVNGSLEYRRGKEWIPAIYHNDIRAQLLAAAPPGVYEFPRKHGRGTNDVTSFHPDYARTGPERPNRHPILFRYEQRGYSGASYEPDIWMHEGRIVLDLDDEPVKKWHEIPLVLSSAYEGYEMEVVRRLNQNIEWQDFRARMPTIVEKTKKEERLSKINRLLPAACHAANSTEGFRDLTGYEIMQAQAPNKGSYPNRAGNRALDDGTRNVRNAADEKRKAKLLDQHFKTVGARPQLAAPNPRPLTRAQKRKQTEEQSTQLQNQTVGVASQTKGRKRRLKESLSDSEDDEDKNRRAKRPHRVEDAARRTKRQSCEKPAEISSGDEGENYNNHELSGSRVQNPNLGTWNLEHRELDGNPPFPGENLNPDPRAFQDFGAGDSGQNNELSGAQNFGYEGLDHYQPSPSPNAPDNTSYPDYGASNSRQNDDDWVSQVQNPNLGTQNIGHGQFNEYSLFHGGNSNPDPPPFRPDQDSGARGSGQNSDEYDIFDVVQSFYPSQDAPDDMRGPYFPDMDLGQNNGLSGFQVHEYPVFVGDYPDPNAPYDTSGPYSRPPVHGFGTGGSGQYDELLGYQKSGYGGSNENPPFSGGYPPRDRFHHETNPILLPQIERYEGSNWQVGHNAPNSTDQHSIPNFDDPRWQHQSVANNMPNLDPQGQPFTANQDQAGANSVADLGEPEPPSSAGDSDESSVDDNRYYVPKNQWEEWTILNALQFTREDHQERLNSPTTIPTNEQSCYIDQYRQMQKTFARRWRRRNEGKPPKLVLLDAWTGDLDNWTPKDPDWKIRMFPTESEAEAFAEEDRRKNEGNSRN